MENRYYLSVDIGASSGCHMLRQNNIKELQNNEDSSSAASFV